MMKELSQLPGKGQEKQIQPSASLETSTGNSVLQQAENNASILLHRSCETISLYAFIKVYCNADFSFLIISGEPSTEQLIEAWQEIVFEWATIVKNQDSLYIAELKKRIGLLEAEIIYIDCAIPRLKDQIKYRVVDQEIIQEIKSMGYSLPAHPTFKQLDMVTSLAKTKVYEHSDLVDEYNSLSKTTSGQKQSEDDFMITVSAVGKFIGYRIKTKETTPFEFSGDLNLLLKSIDESKKNQN